MGLAISFWMLAIVAVVSALLVVYIRDIFRAALSLIVSFFAVAGIYLTLQADFLAAVQVLIYVGAVSILIVFVIMFTHETEKGNVSGSLQFPALIVSIVLLGVMIYSALNTAWKISDKLPPPETTSVIAGRLFGNNGFVLAFEIMAVLLLASVIGALVLAREKE